MKYITIYIRDNKIEVLNSFMGKEIVKVNGFEVSTKYSIFGTEHNFKIIEENKEAHCKLITKFGLYGVVIDFYKNGEPVIESPGSIVIMGIIIGLIVIACLELLRGFMF